VRRVVLAPQFLRATNLAVGHEQVFYEDGLQPSNEGYFEDGGVRPDTILTGYIKMDVGYNDCIMRIAVRRTPALPQYNILCTNCQTWAGEVRREYARLMNDPKVLEECGCPDPVAKLKQVAAAAGLSYVATQAMRMLPSASPMLLRP
jgi:hypothetical protein